MGKIYLFWRRNQNINKIFKNFAVSVAYSTNNTMKNVVIFVHTMINTACVEFMN
jgi:hypothetical protein